MTTSGQSDPPVLDYKTPEQRGPRPPLVPTRRWVWLSIVVVTLLFFAWLLLRRIPDVPTDAQCRSWCADNLRRVGEELKNYSGAHGGRLPESLGQLQILQTYLFVCPKTNDSPADGESAQARAAQLTTGGHLSYIYLGAGLEGPQSDVVLAVDRMSNHDGKVVNALFADGRVECLDHHNARQILDQAAAGVRPVRWPVTRSGIGSD